MSFPLSTLLPKATLNAPQTSGLLLEAYSDSTHHTQIDHDLGDSNSL